MASETALSSSLTFTPQAIDKIVELLQREDDHESLALRVSVRPGGCSGFAYDLFFEDAVQDTDVVLEVNDDLKVVLDKSSNELLAEATLDFTEGLLGAGFQVLNPKAKNSGGCGSGCSC